jgi:hypothetical protein
MKKIPSQLWLCLFLSAFATTAFAQKVNVGYDKSVDFSRYKTYTWAEPAMPPTRPMLYSTVVGSVDEELKTRGLQRVEKDGDLILTLAGGVEFGISGAAGTPILTTTVRNLRRRTQPCGPVLEEARTLPTFQRGLCNCSSLTKHQQDRLERYGFGKIGRRE